MFAGEEFKQYKDLCTLVDLTNLTNLNTITSNAFDGLDCCTEIKFPQQSLTLADNVFAVSKIVRTIITPYD